MDCSFSQDKIPDNKKVILPYKNTIQESAISKTNHTDNSGQTKSSVKNIEEIHFGNFRSDKNVKSSFDLMSSVGSNISFGGFRDNYAVINFTPQISIQPAEFIIIYANHYLNCLIPISGIEKYSASVILQGAALLAIDNTMKFFLNIKENWLIEVVSFAAKNLLVGLFIKPSISDSQNSSLNILHYENYYYSMRITF